MTTGSWQRVKRSKKEGGGVYPGLRYREHAERKHGIEPDRYYTLTIKVDGKTVTEAFGWASEGWTPTKCAGVLKRLKENARTGEGPRTLREMREDQGRKKRAEQDALLAEERRRVTLEKYFEDEYAPAAKAKKKAATWAKEDQHFRTWIGPLLGRERVEDIDLPHWDDLVKRLDTAELSARTKEYVTGTLRRILRFAYDRRVTKMPPPSGKRIGVTGPGGSNRRTRVVTPVEERAIIDLLADSDRHAERFVRFGFLTGARSSEIFGLRWGNVDFVAGVVRFVDTKNKESRELPMSTAVRELLEGMAVGKPDDQVFAKANGRPYSQAPLAYYGAVKRLGLNEGRGAHDKIDFHSVRHTVATRLARRLTIRELMDVMGWRVMAMAARYIKSDDATVRSALDSLGGDKAGKVVHFPAVGKE